MQYDNFVGQVQHRGHLPDTGHAVKSTRAVLQTFGERLQQEERDDLAAQLPGEIAHYLKEANGEVKYDLRGFYEKVSEREGTDLPDAIHHSKAVISVVREAVSAGELADVDTQLPPEFSELLEKQWEES